MHAILLVICPTIPPPCVLVRELRTGVCAVLGFHLQYVTPEEGEPPVIVVMVMKILMYAVLAMDNPDFFHHD
ncbi:hypothetical protein [uncultured Methanospirillum sp.]|uniref:hypothetical protein n=1 Tax=uncultured Methanospirillum sp. TaxID=262503 RepID=UPI0029C8EBCC|nr:hypothetical protein [uncultured Methanospirillum sp.]